MALNQRDRNRKAWADFRAGKGPQPPSRPPRPSELLQRQQVQAKDPVTREVERRETINLRSEHGQLVEMLRVEREKNAFLRTLNSKTPTINITRAEKTSGLREMVAVAMGSDWHVEEEVTLIGSNGRNKYNLDIADASIKRFFQAQVDLVRHHRASKQVVIHDMVCAFSGDLMSGYIHDELKEVNQLSPVQTALWLKPRIVAGLKYLLKELNLRTLLVPWSYGNHGRTTHKTQISTGAENSYEWLLGRMIEQDFTDDKRVKFDTTPSPHQYVDVFDFTLHFHHGDSLKYGGGVGGVGIPLLKAIAAWDDVRYAHWHGVGHFHTLRDYGRGFVNGSMIGYGPYSHWIKAAYEPPQQTFFLIDSKRGKCHSTPLWVRGDEEIIGAKKRRP